MRFDSIQISWFRGAADLVSLDLGLKSMIVYGANGSGKSSFVDAVEFAVNDGRIGHLAHEYSGKPQEKGICNTHTPVDQLCELRIKFSDDSELKAVIDQSGASTRSGAEAVDIDSWDYRRTVLRQDEVGHFIHDTKGRKYSALLPLLGLDEIELAAENLRQLAKSVESESKLGDHRASLRKVKQQQESVFGESTDEPIVNCINKLYSKYCAAQVAVSDAVERCAAIESALIKRIESSTADLKRHIAVQKIAEVHLKKQIGAVHDAKSRLADAVEPLIEEKLRVLESATAFAEKIGDEAELVCPACGRAIPVDAFQGHVAAERERLRITIGNFSSLRSAIDVLCDTLRSMKSNFSSIDLKSWRDDLATGPLGENVAYLDEVDSEQLRKSCKTETLSEIETRLLPLIQVAAETAKDAPPDAHELSSDKATVEAAKTVIESSELFACVQQAETLLSFIKELEKGTRDEIRIQSQSAINEISDDIQNMWSLLHPDEPIEGVELYLPQDADKAIDIRLRFHGIELDSPRLSLSEGYRNSLGICIFLAMAKHEASHDRPLFLDDVVVSLDRNHRGMIAELLTKHFETRQVIILTHDRDWYTELRQQLDSKNWMFKTLLPYESPEVGIRWSNKTTTFDDARAYLSDRPDSAGNDARKIMDVELALIAERLKIKLPYLRGDRNDKRMAHEYLERLISDGKKCFQTRLEKGYAQHDDAISAFETADKLILSWGNRASHSHDLVRPEASKLIDACEKALECFKCDSCNKRVWNAEVASNKTMQCQCGQIRWRYGKA